MKIGVVTATYNRPELLKRLHDSILETTTTTKWIHVVVDDGSSQDYSDLCHLIESYSNNFFYIKTNNGGALVARNYAIDAAVEMGCTHLCFIDDDDLVIGSGLDSVKNAILKFPMEQWFMFPSAEHCGVREWGIDPQQIEWFKDVVIGHRFQGDNLHAVATSLVADLRFTLFGRNQREWLFFYRLSMRKKTLTVMPETCLFKDYQIGGLSHDASKSRVSVEGAVNNIQRAFLYWVRAPLSFKQIINFVRQAALFPLRILIVVVKGRFG
jgi:glycosyltransferase involved in cell wall biosynthesis